MSDLTLKIRDGIWQVSGTVKIPGRQRGVRVRESAGTSRLKDAETYRDKLRQEVIDREIHGPGFSLTFADCVVIYLEKGGEKRFMKPILEKFGETRIKDLTADKVSAFALERYGHLSPSSVKRFFYTPLNAAIRKGTKAHNMAAISFEAPKIEKKLAEYAPRAWFHEFFQHGHFRINSAVFFMTTTAARVSEMCNLRLEDCMFDHPMGPRALLRKTKNGRPRVVVLDPNLVRIMQALITEDGETDAEARVFGYSGRWSVNQAIERVCKVAGIKYYSSHKLGRHSFAARMLENGASLKEVQEGGGWGGIQIVDGSYGHLEKQAVHSLVLDKASAVAPLLLGTSLTHTKNGQNRKGKSNPKKPRKSASGVVGTRGIEPLTPTMSREGGARCLSAEGPEIKGNLDANHVRTDTEPVENLQETKSKV